jgi:hypothetical protein
MIVFDRQNSSGMTLFFPGIIIASIPDAGVRQIRLKEAAMLRDGLVKVSFHAWTQPPFGKAQR